MTPILHRVGRQRLLLAISGDGRAYRAQITLRSQLPSVAYSGAEVAAATAVAATEAVCAPPNMRPADAEQRPADHYRPANDRRIVVDHGSGLHDDRAAVYNYRGWLDYHGSHYNLWLIVIRIRRNCGDNRHCGGADAECDDPTRIAIRR